MALIYHYNNASYSSQGLLLREISKAQKWFLAPGDGYCEKHPHKKVSRAHRCVHETHKHLCARDDGQSFTHLAASRSDGPPQKWEETRGNTEKMPASCFKFPVCFTCPTPYPFILNVLRQERNCGGVTSQVLLLLVSVNKTSSLNGKIVLRKECQSSGARNLLFSALTGSRRKAHAITLFRRSSALRRHKA